MVRADCNQGCDARRLPDTHACPAARHCVRAVKEMDSKSIGLCPQGFESPRCRCRCFMDGGACIVAIYVAVNSIVNKAQYSSYGCLLSCRTCVTVAKWRMWLRCKKKRMQPLSIRCTLRSGLNAATACHTRVQEANCSTCVQLQMQMTNTVTSRSIYVIPFSLCQRARCHNRWHRRAVWHSAAQTDLYRIKRKALFVTRHDQQLPGQSRKRTT